MAQRNTSLRYRTACNEQGAFQPGSRGRVLRNFRGITRTPDIDTAEFEALVEAQEIYLSRVGPDTRITSALLEAVQRGYAGDYQPLALFFVRALERGRGS